MDHVQRGIGTTFPDFVEFQPSGQQCLQWAIVQVLSHFPVVPLVGLHGLRNQLPPHVLQCLHPHRSPRQHVTQRGRRDCEPEQKAEVGVHHVRQPDLIVALRIEDPYGEIAHRRYGSDDRRQHGTVVERDEDRQQEEHREQCRGGTSRHQAQRDDHQHVNGRRCPVRPAGHGPAQHSHQPQHRCNGVHTEDHRIQPGQPVVDLPDPHQDGDQADQREAQDRRDADGSRREVLDDPVRRVVHANPGSCVASPRRRRLRDR